MAGGSFDKETNLSYNYLRDCYDPVTGRYCQSDPIGLGGGINTYAYVKSDPLRYIDPLGLDRWGGDGTGNGGYWGNIWVPPAGGRILPPEPGLQTVCPECWVLGGMRVAKTIYNICKPEKKQPNTDVPAGPATKPEDQIRAEMREKLAEAENNPDMWMRNQERLDAIAEALRQQGYSAQQIVQMMKGLVGF